MVPVAVLPVNTRGGRRQRWKAHQESCSPSRIQHQAHHELLLYGVKRENESPERLR